MSCSRVTRPAKAWRRICWPSSRSPSGARKPWVWSSGRWWSSTDDALATAAARATAAPEVDQVVICSPDKDLTQCVRGTRVVCLDRLRRRTYDEAGVRQKFGVGPGSIPDWLGLVGDSADGIPGVHRWGARSASTVLARFGHLESIPADAGQWDVSVRGAGPLADSLHEHREDALLYRGSRPCARMYQSRKERLTCVGGGPGAPS